MQSLLLTLLVFASAHAALPPNCVPGKVDTFKLRARTLRTGYYPDGSEMEGGFTDRLGKPLQTLQKYLAGKAPYVSVAMDASDDRLPYGTVVRMPAVELYFHRCIEFRVVDTGDRFDGTGTSKTDICNDTNKESLGDWTNGMADLYIVGHQ